MTFWDDLASFGIGVVDTGKDLLGGLGDVFGGATDSSLWGDIAGLAGSLIGEGGRIYLTQESADAALAAGESAARVFYGNADLFYTEAEDVERRTYNEMVKAEYNGLQFMARQQMQYMASGVTLEGSPLIVANETRDIIEMELLDIQERGQAEARQLRERAKLEELKAEHSLDDASFQAEVTQIGGIVQSAEKVFGF